jgi:hypothetical protein
MNLTTRIATFNVNDRLPVLLRSHKVTGRALVGAVGPAQSGRYCSARSQANYRCTRSKVYRCPLGW